VPGPCRNQGPAKSAKWQKFSVYAVNATSIATRPRDGHNAHVRGHWAYKRVIGDGLRSRTEERRATEVAVAAHALNHMLELGRPSYVRIA